MFCTFTTKKLNFLWGKPVFAATTLNEQWYFRQQHLSVWNPTVTQILFYNCITSLDHHFNEKWWQILLLTWKLVCVVLSNNYFLCLAVTYWWVWWYFVIPSCWIWQHPRRLHTVSHLFKCRHLLILLLIKCTIIRDITMFNWTWTMFNNSWRKYIFLQNIHLIIDI